MWHRCPYRLRSGCKQEALRSPDLVDQFKADMLGGNWDYARRGSSFVYWRQGHTVWVGEGHHRANAALEIGRETGDWSHLHRLLDYGFYHPGTPPEGDQRPFPTRRFWSWLFLILGW